jgi:hypothetical protein
MILFTARGPAKYWLDKLKRQGDKCNNDFQGRKGSYILKLKKG